MPVARWLHTATVLSDGRVLLAGGLDTNGNPLSSAVLYTPANHSFASTGNMTAFRYAAAATRLPSGKVLITGGSGTTSSDLYDPASGTFTSGGTMTAVRSTHSATLLFNGTVLIAGGQGASQDGVNSAELYNPASGGFTPVGNLATARFGHSATLLYDGTVLISGGTLRYSTPVSAELFNPTTLTFGSTGAPTSPRYLHSAVSLRNGMVLLAGGIGANRNELSSAEIYNPAAKSFSATASMATTRDNFTGVLQSDGSVFLPGGGDATTSTANAEIYTYPFTAGAIHPKYQVLGVLYSPPGSRSSVTYAGTNTIGTSTSFNQSVTQNTTFGLSDSGKVGGVSTGFSASSSFTEASDSLNSFAVNQTTQNTISLSGPLSSQVGVDHNFDRVLVWLNPQADVAVGPVQSTLLWSGFSVDTRDSYIPSDLDVVPVTIYCLQNPYVADCTSNNYRFARSWDSSTGGLTATDFASIANADPFVANPQYNPDADSSHRFQVVSGTNVDYSPAPAGAGPTTYSKTVSVQQVGTSSQSASDTHQIGYSFDAGLSGPVSIDLKDAKTTTWVNTLSSQQSLSTGQSA